MNYFSLFFLYLFLLLSAACSSMKVIPFQWESGEVQSGSAFSCYPPNLNRNPAQVVTSCSDVLSSSSVSSNLFLDSRPIKFFLSGDFDRIHKANEGGNWTGEERTDPVYWSSGVLQIEGDSRKLNVRMRARGMSSAQEGELDFPKLRVEIEKAEDLNGHTFQGNRKFKMNTHGRDVNPPGELSRMGRLLDERSPYREAFIYELGEAWDLPAPFVRRAHVSYRDNQTGNETTRNALIIETDGNFAKRKGWQEYFDFPDDESKDKMDLDLAVRFHLFNILVGNDDIGLRLKREPSISTERYRPLFNTTIFKDSTGNLYPILYDFDLAWLVGGWDQRKFETIQSSYFNVIHGRLGYFFTRLAQLRSRLSKSEFDRNIQFYFSHVKPQFEGLIKSANVDNDAREMFREMTLHFDQAISLLAQFQMLMKREVGFFEDKNLRVSLLTDDNIQTDAEGNSVPRKLRPGTPVVILQRGSGWVKIAIWDMAGDLKDFSKHVGFIRDQDLVLSSDLPEDLQGYFNENDF